MTALTFRTVTADCADDLARLGERYGRFGYCSCMRWRIPSRQYKQSTKASRAEALGDLARGGESVGVLAYEDDEPVGWCSIAPREQYSALERYRALPRVDEVPVWAVVCFFVAPEHRRTGVTEGLLGAAVDAARAAGAAAVEGYPVKPGERLYTYMGAPVIFERLGFLDVTPEGQARRVMRLSLS